MRQMVIPGLSGVRAFDNPAINLTLGIDELVTELVIGTPQDMVMPGAVILPDLSVRQMTYRYTKYGTEHLAAKQTERGLRAPIQASDYQVTYETGSLTRHSWRVERDVAEFAVASRVPGMRLREQSALFARRMVEMDIERRRALLLTTPGTYDAGHVINANGDEWDKPGTGDSLADINVVTNAIAAKFGIMPEELTVFLSLKARNAAFNDPTFKAQRAGTDSGIRTPTLAELTNYWNVKRVWSANPVQLDDDGVTINPLYGEVAIIYYEVETSRLDTTFGGLTAGRTFRFNDGVASDAWYDNLKTCWNFSWNAWAEPTIISPNVMGLIYNVKL